MTHSEITANCYKEPSKVNNMPTEGAYRQLRLPKIGGIATPRASRKEGAEVGQVKPHRELGVGVVK